MHTKPDGNDRAAQMLALCEALQITRETNAAVDVRALRDATCNLVTGLKSDGFPIERVIARVMTLAQEAGFPITGREIAAPDDEHLRILLEEVVRICIEAYYR